MRSDSFVRSPACSTPDLAFPLRAIAACGSVACGSVARGSVAAAIAATVLRRCCVLAIALTALLGLSIGDRLSAAESTEESIALYADAANFQTGGAIELAIQNWKKFLEMYPDDDLASKAAHYLGVCYMQKENPDYVAAAEAFGVALEDKKYELREESLANRGWCFYASAGDGPRRDRSQLQKTIETFETLRKENSKSAYIDRAYFYSGEAAYGLGERARAIEFYHRFLSLPSAKDSPLRCDALYALGIAHEELDQTGEAVETFEKLLNGCADSPLVVDVHLRLGDLMIAQRDYPAAVTSFDKAIAAATEDADTSYAIFRRSYALVQDGKPTEAAAGYDRLQREFPDSPYAANATLASGQSLYRGGDIDQAAARFETVLTQNSPVAATEAAHWLARIKLAKGDAAAAVAIAKQRLDSGVEGDFAIDLRVDLAEALSMNPATVAESIAVAEQVYRDAPDDPLAPRALYNAAFSALQVNDYEKAGRLAGEFLKQFASDPLESDVRFIVAESQLFTGKTQAAVDSYQALLETAAADNVQRPVWVLRTAVAMNSMKAFDDAVALLKKEYASLEQASHKAEAQFLVGQAHLMSDRPADAAESFGRVAEVAPEWSRTAEARLLQGTALLSAGKSDQANAAWQALIDRDPASAMADQARYKLGQLASKAGDYAQAVKLYSQIIDAGRDQGLIPYALYGRGWSHMQQGNHAEALKSLDVILDQSPGHSLSDDALIARGISHRTLGDLQSAQADLQQYLELRPTGVNLGHALYELALVDQKQSRPGDAAEKLQRLVDEVAGYPAMDKVLYELGWSLRESDKETQAVEQFRRLLDEYPETPLAAEAAYFVGQQRYSASDWPTAVKYFRIAADKTSDDAMSEKALYRLGWSLFKESKLDEAREAFAKQAEKHPGGNLAIDARMMVGECLFKQESFEEAVQSYAIGRQKIREADENANTLRDAAERQVRELILLHGGQSAAQLKRWDEAIGWYDELKQRFPATAYLPQVFYETGFAYQQKGDLQQALKYFGQVAEQYRRREVGARARFMMGEIYFGEKQFDKAIPEFQSVMFGFGGENAPPAIKNWQAKSGFEAGRCSELLMQSARTQDAKNRSRKFATQFYQYVVQKHAGHELAKKSAERLEALQ
ncbi:tetratricopeptide repeat protein [Rhodopirellula sp. JC639]|uniref:tetratricopeptide repeat protein n=1 Tax=Stieleria mannarensis TaxID=2755585 RepID=UPI00336A7025